MKIFLNNKINRVDVLDERFYTLDNKTFYPSVTTVLSSYPKGYGFEEWLKTVGHNAEAVKNQAAEQGSNVHNAIEAFLNGEELTWITDGRQNYTLKEWQMICRFMEFFDRYLASKEYACEVMLFSEKLRLGGTADLICTIDGETWLIDYKTSNALYKTNEMQLAAYKEMYDEKSTPKIDRYGILWLNSNHRAEKVFQGVGWILKECTASHDHNLRLYHHTRALWDEENPNYKPKNLVYPNSFKK